MKARLITDKNHPVVKQDLEECEMLEAIEVYEMQKKVDDLIEDFFSHKNFFENELNVHVPLVDEVLMDLFNTKIELNKKARELRFEVIAKTEERVSGSPE